jgi:hypothetical protein
LSTSTTVQDRRIEGVHLDGAERGSPRATGTQGVELGRDPVLRELAGEGVEEARRAFGDVNHGKGRVGVIAVEPSGELGDARLDFRGGEEISQQLLAPRRRPPTSPAPRPCPAFERWPSRPRATARP